MAVTTLVEALNNASKHTNRGYTFLDSSLLPTTWVFADLEKEARRRAAKLQALGLVKGDRLAMIVPEPEDFVLTFLGAVVAGIVPVPMYPPLALGRLDSYIESAASILKTSGARMLFTTKQVAPVLWSLVSKVSTLEDIVLADKIREKNEADAPMTPVEISAEDACFLQFTSGSTAAPKGVIVSHGSLSANAKAIMFDGLKCIPTRDEVGVSWLPLYHDMGLIGFVIAPLFADVPVVFIPTISFVKRPTVWMDTVHKYRGTITFGPNFAFGLAAKRAPKTAGALDLSCLRVVGCGAEPINPQTMRTFVQAFEPFGISPNALMPCYGMAEATLAMSFDRLTSPMRTLTIDRGEYEARNVAVSADEATRPGDKIELVACGRTFDAHAIAVMDANGKLLKDGCVGEIVFRGPSVTPGYFENAEATKELLRDGWLHTGDLGFIDDGDLFISGRQKDLIILNGRNYYPQAIEWIVERAEGVRKGNVVAFSTAGEATEKLVIVAETVAEDLAKVEASIIQEVKNALGLQPDKVALVGKGAIPKTSSGKLQRRKTKIQYDAGTLGRAGNRSVGSTAARVTLFRHMTQSVFARLRHRVKNAIPAVLRPRANRAVTPEV